MQDIPSSHSQAYQVLARRTRPQDLDGLVGQPIVSNAIRAMCSSNSIPHAFLLTGTRGTGKTSTARILAKCICCVNGPTASPCNVCVHCTQITVCGHEDVLEIDGASNNGVDNVRELKDSTRFYPSSAKYKVYIIDEVHMLSTSAFNALLKTLEEPPDNVVFILATTELHKVPATVKSRCAVLAFKKIDVAVIRAHLGSILEQEQKVFDVDALTLIAREAKGSMRDALSLLEQVLASCPNGHLTCSEVSIAMGLSGQDWSRSLFKAIMDLDAPGALTLLSDADSGLVDFSGLLEQSAGYCRIALIAKQTPDRAFVLRMTETLDEELDWIIQTSAKASNTALSECFRALMMGIKDVSQSNAARSWCELIVLDCINRAQWLSPFEVFNGNQSQPSAVSAMQQPPPLASAPAGATIKAPARGSKIDMQEFAKLLSNIEKKSLPLASKLKHAVLNEFSAQRIEFADIQRNRVVTDLSSSDIKILSDCMQEGVFKNAQIVGLPKAAIGGANPIAKHNPVSNPNLPQVKTPNMSFLSLPKSQLGEDRAESLADHQSSERRGLFDSKVAELQKLPFMQKLAEVAQDIEFVPLEKDIKT